MLNIFYLILEGKDENENSTIISYEKCNKCNKITKNSIVTLIKTVSKKIAAFNIYKMIKRKSEESMIFGYVQYLLKNICREQVIIREM